MDYNVYMESNHSPLPDIFAEGPDTWWVVLADGTLLSDLTPEEYDRYSNSGQTIDGGRG